MWNLHVEFLCLYQEQVTTVTRDQVIFSRESVRKLVDEWIFDLADIGYDIIQKTVSLKEA